MISIKHVYKTYDGGAEALSDINLEIADGDIFGIIGMSGAGKSTLVRTINLLERPTTGVIEVDGRDVTALSGEELRAYRRRVAMIFQNFGLLAQKTVLDNVCFPFLAATGKVTEANRARALELLDRVGLAEKAQSYPSQLSGGQKQRVAIARVFLKNPKILILDEATSALDNESEEAVQESLERLAADRTTIIIAHRLSTIKHADEIATVERGRVVERGTHEELLARGGTYARYYRMQFEGARARDVR